jgi:DNA-binding transcriptional regulator YdaS (Cro superfamily)
MGIESRLQSPLAEAVRTVGSQSAFARLVGKSQPAVFQLLQQDGLLWPEAVLAVETATGISRHRLRPDVYGPEPTIEPAATPDGVELAR